MDLKRRRRWGQVHLEFSVSQRVVGLEMIQTHCSTVTPVPDCVGLGVFPSLFLVGRILRRNITYPVLSIDCLSSGRPGRTRRADPGSYPRSQGYMQDNNRASEFPGFYTLHLWFLRRSSWQILRLKEIIEMKSCTF